MSDITNVIIGVLAGGFVTYLVQVLIEKQKLMLDQKARLTRLHIDIRAAIGAIDTIVAAADARRSRCSRDVYIRPAWDENYDVPASLSRLQQFSERLRPDSEWFPLLHDDSRDLLLSAPLRLGRLIHDVDALSSKRQQVSTSSTETRLSILEQLRAICATAATNDEIDALLTAALGLLRGILMQVSRRVEEQCDGLDTWFTRPPAA